MSYQSIRNTIMKNQVAFDLARFFFTPIRMTKEHCARRKMANTIIEQCTEIEKDMPKIFYFGIPEHNNLGDIAQTYCTNRWIKENYPDHFVIQAKTRVTFDKKFNNFMRKTISSHDLILFQSGYCTRHKNPDHLMHLHIAKLFPAARMVILPQTVNLNDRADIAKSNTIFGKCSHLKFITRDSKSYDFAKAFINEKDLACFPDVVTSLIGREEVKSERKGALLCIRDDAEKFYSDNDLEILREKLSSVFGEAVRTDTNSDKSAEEVYCNLEEEIKNKIRQFARYECVITDRYHGTIFSLIANTPVIVIKTNDHKVTSALEWFDSLYDEGAVQLADSLDSALMMAEHIHKTNKPLYNNDRLYQLYYKTALKELIDSL